MLRLKKFFQKGKRLKMNPNEELFLLIYYEISYLKKRLSYLQVLLKKLESKIKIKNVNPKRRIIKKWKIKKTP